jgi:hypothetical protein
MKNNMNKEFETILRWNDSTETLDRLYRYADGTEVVFSRGVDRRNENTK